MSAMRLALHTAPAVGRWAHAARRSARWAGLSGEARDGDDGVSETGARIVMAHGLAVPAAIEALRDAGALLDCEARIALEQLLRELRPFAWAP